MDLDVEEKAREIRLRFCGAISGKEGYRYAPERLGRSGGGMKQRGRAKAVTRDQGERLGEAISCRNSAVKGRSDVVFANAGVAEFAPLGKLRRNISTNSSASTSRETLFTVQKALPLLNDGGSIILNGSVASVKGTPPSASTARRRLLCAPSSEPGPRLSRTAIFVPRSSAPGRRIRRSSMDNPQTPCTNRVHHPDGADRER